MNLRDGQVWWRAAVAVLVALEVANDWVDQGPLQAVVLFVLLALVYSTGKDRGRDEVRVRLAEMAAEARDLFRRAVEKRVSTDLFHREMSALENACREAEKVGR